MKVEDFYKKHGGKWASILAEDIGKDLMEMLRAAKPTFSPHPVEHLFLENTGAQRGYDQCIKNMFFAAIPKVPMATPSQDYGVKKPVEPAPFIPVPSTLETPKT